MGREAKQTKQSRAKQSKVMHDPPLSQSFVSFKAKEKPQLHSPARPDDGEFP